MSAINNSLPQDLADAVHGRLEAFARLSGHTHEELQQARDSLNELLVTAGDVGKVLAQLLERKISPEQAQAWAFFVRRGYIGYWQSRPITDEMRRDFKRSGTGLIAIHQAVPSGHSGPIRPIDIRYDPAAEDSIVDAVARLDDIHMEMFGPLSESEITELLHTLAETGGEGQRD